MRRDGVPGTPGVGLKKVEIRTADARNGFHPGGDGRAERRKQ